MSYIDINVIDDIVMRTDIVQVIGERVPLKKSGQNWLALCPFHKEKTPSFTVNSAKQIFYCFGCHAGGNVIKFLMRYESLTFMEALQKLAKALGIVLNASQQNLERIELTRNILDILRQSVAFYQHTLQKQAHVIEYLTKRGIGGDTISRFSIGFAPDGFRQLLTYLTKKGFDAKTIAAAGVLTQQTQNDLFRNRVMLPIMNTKNQCIALGGRVIESDAMPKYLNSPDTALFNKRKSLFGLNFAHESIRRKGYALIVEGYFDVIVCHQHGFDNAVAPLGTALTEDQAKLIKRYANSAAMAFDGDQAGGNAAKRGFDLLLSAGIEAKAFILPQGEDPDSFLRKQGTEAFQSGIDRALSISGFFASLDEKKSALLKEVLDITAKIPDNVLKGELIKNAAEDFKIRENFLIDELNKKSKALHKKSVSAEPREVKDDAKPQEKPKEEIYLLKIILQYPKKSQTIFKTLTVQDFSDDTIQSIIRKMPSDILAYDGMTLLDRIDGEVDETEKKLISDVFLSYETIGVGEVDKFIQDCVVKLKKRQCEKKRYSIQDRIKEAEKSNNIALVLTLLEEKNKLFRQGRDE
jgi:DNA primase